MSVAFGSGPWMITPCSIVEKKEGRRDRLIYIGGFIPSLEKCGVQAGEDMRLRLGLGVIMLDSILCRMRNGVVRLGSCGCLVGFA